MLFISSDGYPWFWTFGSYVYTHTHTETQSRVGDYRETINFGSSNRNHTCTGRKQENTALVSR